MSLIEEALRRAQQGPVIPPAEPPPPLRATPPPAAPARPGQPPPAPQTTTRRSSPVGASVTVSLLLAIVGWWALSRSSYPRPMVSGSPAGGSQPLEPSSAAAIPPTPATAPADAVPTASRRFFISGIVEGSGTPYAVMNGQVVSVGDTVGTATVLAIGQGAVRLQLSDGTEQTLAVTP